MSRWSPARRALVVGILATGLAAPPAVAAADPAEPGPALSVTERQLDAALTCSQDLGGVKRDPVLLTPAFSTDQQSYGWNYLRALPAAGIAICSLSLPDHGFGDLQVAAEYVVAAVRAMHRDSDRQVALVGHQHGALDELWALLHWPDLPAKVSDLVSMATPYQGTESSRFACSLATRCPPAAWQIAAGSTFVADINAHELPAGVAFTSIATAYDPLIVPQPRASHLDGATNIALQSICPGRPIEHFTILGDNLTYRLVRDALDHPGPADPRRIPRSTCFTLMMPGVSPLALLAAVGTLVEAVVRISTTSVPAEPAVVPH